MRSVSYVTIAGSVAVLCVMSSWSFFSAAPPQEKGTGHEETIAQNLDEESKHQKANAFLKQHAPGIDLTTDVGKKRLGLIIDQFANEDDSDQLILSYQYFPEAFKYKELASIALARALIAHQHTHIYQEVRENWKDHEREPEEWLFLDAEALVLEGQQEEAAALLASRSFRNEHEKDRLIRLALLHLIENPKLSWKYLSEASLKNPNDAALHTFKASLLESANKREMAAAEYIIAVQKDPENPYLRENLADFYLRNGQYDEALQILEDSLTSPSLDSLWLKEVFWSQVVSPMKLPFSASSVPDGKLKPLVDYLIALSPGIYWNEDSFIGISNGPAFLENQQETFWLRLLMKLKNEEEDQALELLLQHPFQTTSWMPQLEKNLKTAIAYRKAQKRQKTFDGSSSHSLERSLTSSNDKQQFLSDLDSYSNVSVSQISSIDLPKILREIILNKDIFSILFLAYGWDEAALQLRSVSVVPAAFPDWISHSMTEAIGRNRSQAQALQYALNQNPTPELSLLVAELFLAIKDQEKAIETLKNIYKRNDPIGLKAAKLLSTVYLDQGNAGLVNEILSIQPALAAETVIKEAQARTALQNGDINTANALYLELEQHSYEAKSFLARKAFAEKNWQRARMLAQDLLKQFPDNPTLKDNLQKISLEEQK